MKLNVKSLALSFGVTWGVAIFLLTYWLLIFGYDGLTLAKLGKVYLGYSVTWYGALIGLIWGFVDGLIGGALVAYLYNKFLPE